MSRFAIAIAAVSACTLQAAAATVHFSNGTQIWTSTNGGVSFAMTDSAAAVTGNSGIVGLGYSPTNGYFATTVDGWLHKVTGLGTSSVVLTRFKDLGSSTISFDFFGGGNILRGVRGDDLIEFDVSNASNSVDPINLDIGPNSVPATARVGSDYYGMTADGNVYHIKTSGTADQIGANNVTGLSGADVAGGSSNPSYSQFFVAAGFNQSGANNDIVRFGTIDHTTGAYTQISQFNLGADLAGQMGMVLVPLPHAATMGLAGLCGLGLVARLRRR